MTGCDERGSVAVVVPARNSGRLLATCLDSLKEEIARRNADLVVVDDASSDDTATVAATGG